LLLFASGASEIKCEGRTIRGVSRANSGGVAGNFGSYFVLQFDRDLTKCEVIGSSNNVAAYEEFKTAPNDPVEVRIGTSFISWEQAEQNLRAETSGGFDAVHARLEGLWNTNLSRVEITASEEQLKTFYSCLYRAQMFPHRLYEIDATGKPIHYSPYDGKIHDGVLYGDIGIWDAFRTTFPLITILYPAQLDEILQGFVNASAEGGTLPEWPSPGYRDCMIGQHCAAIFADAVVKGHTGFDVAAAYASLRRSAFQLPTEGQLVRRGLADYLQLGFIPDGASTYAVSATLDYAYDDWCAAQIARQLDKREDYNLLMTRAQNYRNLWDTNVAFMRPKNRAGHWVEPFDPFGWGGPYAEGGPWQSSWFAPHDTAGLASLLGGPEKLTAKLDQMLGLPPVFHVGGYGQVIHEMSEMGHAKFGQYAHNNQPVFDVLYLFAACGEPWQTEYWTHRVCAELYNSTPQGFQGDEDNGSMASWYVLSSVGLYPLCPGTTQYMFTSPLFSKSTLHLAQGKSLTTTASSHSGQNVYVQSRQLDGQTVTHTFITHDDLMHGGDMRLEMGPFPKISPRPETDLPYSASR
ncbi:MAG TPA: GH92 family glycosyl hydrolase, partial [Verrucomicrobiae bacterium]|jgi:predicted alpha-1,2-mannosidase|nr:GH92 family glycosyl hydrolase [Verrucomicrobiae bacterium]